MWPCCQPRVCSSCDMAPTLQHVPPTTKSCVVCSRRGCAAACRRTRPGRAVPSLTAAACLALAARFKVHELRGKTKAELFAQVGACLTFGGSLAALQGNRTYADSRHPCCAHLSQLKELKTELAALRVAKVTGGAPNKLSKMCADRNSSAQQLMCTTTWSCYDTNKYILEPKLDPCCLW